MSKPVKDMMVREYLSRFGETSEALLISIRGIGGHGNSEIRMGMARKGINITVVRNNLARKAFAETDLGLLSPLLEGPCALACGGESVVEVAREIVELLKKFPELELKGAVLDGELFEGNAGVQRLSKFPTRDEAIAEDVALVLGPGRKLVGAVKGPGSRLVGILKALEEKLESGQEIAKVSS